MDQLAGIESDITIIKAFVEPCSYYYIAVVTKYQFCICFGGDDDDTFICAQ